MFIATTVSYRIASVEVFDWYGGWQDACTITVVASLLLAVDIHIATFVAALAGRLKESFDSLLPMHAVEGYVIVVEN
jgi:hypothetical protein